MTEGFVWVGESSKILTVRTVKYQITCYQLWSDSKMKVKTIIDKRILHVKTCVRLLMFGKKTKENGSMCLNIACRSVFKNSRKISICDQSVTFIMISSFLSKEGESFRL